MKKIPSTRQYLLARVDIDMRNERLYYYRLANADSYWGKVFYEVLNRKHEGISDVGSAHETNHGAKSVGVTGFKEILRARKNHRLKELRINDELKAYRYLSLPFYLRWLSHPIVVPLITVPVCVTILYLPLYLIQTETRVAECYFKPSKSFIVTEKFLEESLIKSTVSDMVPPSAPGGISIKSK